jgi:sugar O-acyltransferase (sialic acid O-acetyltransferase NeuD family)
MNKQRLAIIGSGDLGKFIAHHARNDGHYVVAGYLDDFATKGHAEGDIPILGRVADAMALYQQQIFDCIMVGIGYKHMAIRKEIFEKLRGEIPFGKIVHSSAYLDSSVSIGEGVFILPGCTLDKDVVIGDNVLLNTAAVIAHDTRIDDHCFLAPAVSIAGKVHIQECCIIGINATIIDHLTIVQGVQIGAGAVVIETIDQPGLYAGVPAVLKRLFK